MKHAYHNALILFFVRYPETGAVKTRLAASIGSDEAAELYRNFVMDILVKLESSGFPLEVCFYPKQKRDAFVDWLGGGYAYYPQAGKDLGERMKAAFTNAFAGGHNRVVLIGSDFPDLPLSFFKESLDALNTYDAVIGPSVDGGYYLIGFRDRAFFPHIFEGMEWGTETVFRKTLSMLKAHKKRTYILPAWNDVDTVEDLEQLIQRSKGSDFLGSRTMSYLSELEKR